MKTLPKLCIWKRLGFLDLLTVDGKIQHILKMVVFHGDESHGIESVKRSPSKQTQVIKYMETIGTFFVLEKPPKSGGITIS